MIFQFRAAILSAALSLTMCASAFAHDPGLSSANLQIEGREASLVLTFNERDMAGLLGVAPAALHPQDVASAKLLDATARRAITLKVDGELQNPARLAASVDANNNIQFTYKFALPAAAKSLSIESTLLKDLPFGHRQAFAARDSSGQELTRAMLSGRATEAVVAIDSAGNASTGATFREFLQLGVHHIITGYDHLLFLLALLIVCRDARSALTLITSFTVAHSLTLGLATFGLVSLPSRFVEATIAASIVYVAVENMLRSRTSLGRRALLTFGFGLVHGLGFASVLREMGVASTGAAAVVPLVSFNAGVEIGQLAIAAIVLPVIWSLRKRPAFLRVGVPACSLLVAAAGAYWLIQRTLWT